MTLIQAFRICQVQDEAVYLRTANGSPYHEYYFWSENVRKLLDMKKIKVCRIDVCYTSGFSEVWAGWLFIVRGISDEELHKMSIRE